MPDTFLECSLTARTRRALSTAIDCLKLEHPDQDPEQYAISLAGVFRDLAPDTEKLLRDATERDFVAVHVKNLASETVTPKTPYDGKVDFLGTKRTVANIYSVIGAMGLNPILYPDEETTTLRVVSARYNSNDEKSSQSPHSNLAWHVDMAYRPFSVAEDELSPMPDYLVFGVVSVGETYLPLTYITTERLVGLLTEEELAAGLAREFEISSPDSIKKAVCRSHLALFELNDKGSYHNRINMEKTRPLTARAEQLLQKISKITADREIAELIHFDAGDVIALNNKNTVHTRAPYTPHWNGFDRYLVRVYATRNLDAGFVMKPASRWEWK